MHKRILDAARSGLSVLHSVLLTAFLCLGAMILAAYLGAGGLVTIGAGIVGLTTGAAVSRRLWFG